MRKKKKKKKTEHNLFDVVNMISFNKMSTHHGEDEKRAECVPNKLNFDNKFGDAKLVKLNV